MLDTVFGAIAISGAALTCAHGVGRCTANTASDVARCTHGTTCSSHAASASAMAVPTELAHDEQAEVEQ